MNKLSTWLWFESEAEAAARFYASVFRGTVGAVVRAPAGAEPYNKEGQVLTAAFTIEGQEFYCLNGGNHPGGVPNDAVSHQILCADQNEVDDYWNRLKADGGKESQCGWVIDKYGFRWQIVPEVLYRYMNGGDREVARRVTQAMFTMQKLDVAALEAAARG
jgi:predicted 3-demethylubiquinone-9 3-methyltransferase (glyoxalase superfamily)